MDNFSDLVVTKSFYIHQILMIFRFKTVIMVTLIAKHYHIDEVYLILNERIHSLDDQMDFNFNPVHFGMPQVGVFEV